MNLSMFDKNYKNDQTGAKAIPPSVLIKLIIYGYLKGVKSSHRTNRKGGRTGKETKSIPPNGEKHVAKHRRQDEHGNGDKETERHYQERQKKLNRQIEKISDFLESMEKKEWKREKETRSNVTDNESALIYSSKEYIQGQYIG